MHYSCVSLFNGLDVKIFTTFYFILFNRFTVNSPCGVTFFCITTLAIRGWSSVLVSGFAGDQSRGASYFL